MNSYAMEQVTRERIANWHREARDEMMARTRLTRKPRVWFDWPVARLAEQSGAGLLASLRRFAARLVTAA